MTLGQLARSLFRTAVAGKPFETIGALSRPWMMLRGSAVEGATSRTMMTQKGSCGVIGNLSARPGGLFSLWRGYHGLSTCNRFNLTPSLTSSLPLKSTVLQKTPETVALTVTRGVTKFSLRKGRRKTVKAVILRFYRLDWGAWISPKPGRARHLWKQSIQRRQRLRHHIFRKTWESKTLDRMVTKYWIKKKHFVNDPYESYHTRDNFRITKGIHGINSTSIRKIKRYRTK